MTKGHRWLFVIGLFAFVCPGEARVGLLGRGTDVVLENLSLGRSYNLRTAGKYPYTITNAGDAPVDVKVEIEIPREKYLREGYEPIPDPRWIKVVPDTFKLAPGESQTSDIILSLDADEKYNGRHYQVMLWAHTMDTGMLGTGVRNRLRFSVGTPGPGSLQEEKIRKRMQTIDFDIKPESVFLSDIEPGVVYDAKKKKELTLKIANRGESKIRLRFQSVAPQPEAFARMDYQPVPDPSWVSVEPEEAVIKPDQINSVRLRLKIPKKEELKGKKFGCLIKTVIAGDDLPIEMFNKVYIKMKE